MVGKKLGAPIERSSIRLLRAGFEPFRGVLSWYVFAESQFLLSSPGETVVSSDLAVTIKGMSMSCTITYARNGSKPARKHLNG